MKSLKSHYWPRICETDEGWELKRRQSADTAPVSLFLCHPPSPWERFNYPHTPGDRPSVTSGNQRRVADSWMNRAKDAISRHAISMSDLACLYRMRCRAREVKAQIPLFAKRFRHRVTMWSENSSWKTPRPDGQLTFTVLTCPLLTFHLRFRLVMPGSHDPTTALIFQSLTGLMSGGSALASWH